MRLVLDAGALIGIDRADRRVAGLIELGRRSGAELVTTAPVVAQAWRDGARQARLARSLAMMHVEVTDLEAAKNAGELLASSRTTDVVDALLALQVRQSDQVLTSDPDDLATLLDAQSLRAQIVLVEDS